MLLLLLQLHGLKIARMRGREMVNPKQLSSVAEMYRLAVGSSSAGSHWRKQQGTPTQPVERQRMHTLQTHFRSVRHENALPCEPGNCLNLGGLPYGPPAATAGKRLRGRQGEGRGPNRSPGRLPEEGCAARPHLPKSAPPCVQHLLSEAPSSTSSSINPLYLRRFLSFPRPTACPLDSMSKGFLSLMG